MNISKPNYRALVEATATRVEVLEDVYVCRERLEQYAIDREAGAITDARFCEAVAMSLDKDRERPVSFVSMTDIERDYEAARRKIRHGRWAEDFVERGYRRVA